MVGGAAPPWGQGMGANSNLWCRGNGALAIKSQSFSHMQDSVQAIIYFEFINFLYK